MSKETGGTAFPVQSIYIEDQETNSKGMTLRDYFAAKAMQGLCSTIDQKLSKPYWNVIAEDSYEMADAMLKAREQ